MSWATLLHSFGGALLLRAQGPAGRGEHCGASAILYRHGGVCTLAVRHLYLSRHGYGVT